MSPTLRSRTLVLTRTLSLLATFVAFVPTGSAHYCRGLLPSDCGGCSSGDHDHTCCSSNDPGACTTRLSPDTRATEAVSQLKVQEIIDVVC